MKTPRENLERILTKYGENKYICIPTEDLRQLLELVKTLEEDNESLDDYNRHLDQTLSDYGYERS